MLLIGYLLVIICVFGGFAAMGGNLGVLWQPWEAVIILGSGLSAFLAANPSFILKHVGGALGYAVKGKTFVKEDYEELLLMEHAVFKLIRSKGMLELESHIENPEESSIFTNYPRFRSNKIALNLFCDYMRMLTMGAENPYQMEDLLNEEIGIIDHEHHQMVSSFQSLGDGLPALGIVAAVLGVIKTMGKINSPPEVLGHAIGGALVGTFLGVLLSYGFAAPLSSLLKSLYESEKKYYDCIKAGILAHMNGYAPIISVEFARKSIEPHNRPTFYELEEAINNSTSKS